MVYGTRITALCIAILMSLSLAASAGEVTGLIEFQNETRADADQVNGNFDAVKRAVDDNNQKINALSQPRSASVTYSAMGFTPKKSKLNGPAVYELEFEKSDDGYLKPTYGGSFYHNVALRSGVTITQIRALIDDADEDSDTGHIEVKLTKLQFNNDEQPTIVPIELCAITSQNAGIQVISAELNETIESSDTGYPPSYFIEVNYRATRTENLRFYSVTIDYEYTAP
jgi:hypothetical protein